MLVRVPILFALALLCRKRIAYFKINGYKSNDSVKTPFSSECNTSPFSGIERGVTQPSPASFKQCSEAFIQYINRNSIWDSDKTVQEYTLTNSTKVNRIELMKMCCILIRNLKNRPSCFWIRKKIRQKAWTAFRPKTLGLILCKLFIFSGFRAGRQSLAKLPAEDAVRNE